MSRSGFLLTLALVALALFPTANAAAPSGRYTMANGTVYDTKTKLTWQQTISPTTFSYADAVSYCTNLGATLSGGGWRIPTVKELLTILDFSQPQAPWIDSSAFPGTPLHYFWTSTTRVDLTSSGTWVIDFSGGAITTSPGAVTSPGMSTTNNVRCVH